MSIVSQIDALGYSEKGHSCGAFSSHTLAKIEALLPSAVERSCETGCGKSTILFSNISGDHTVFTYDDRDSNHSSVAYYRDCPITRLDRVTQVFGATLASLRV
jgi:hypothetical protein